MVRKLSPIFVPNETFNLSDWIPPYDSPFHDIHSHSWFNMKSFKNPDSDPIIKHSTITGKVPDDSYAQQYRSLRRRKIDRNPSLLRVKHVRLYPDTHQKKFLMNGFTLPLKCLMLLYDLFVIPFMKMEN